MDESSLVDDPHGNLAREAALIRDRDAARFDATQAAAEIARLSRRASELEVALLDAGLAVAREAHRDGDRRPHWMEVLRRINELLR